MLTHQLCQGFCQVSVSKKKKKNLSWRLGLIYLLFIEIFNGSMLIDLLERHL